LTRRINKLTLVFILVANCKQADIQHQKQEQARRKQHEQQQQQQQQQQEEEEEEENQPINHAQNTNRQPANTNR